MSRDGSVKTVVPGQNEGEVTVPMTPPDQTLNNPASKKSLTNEMVQSPMTQAPHERPLYPNFESNENFDNSQPQIDYDEEGASPDRPQSMAQYRAATGSEPQRRNTHMGGIESIQQQEGANQVS